jgi:hypothetical protein
MGAVPAALTPNTPTVLKPRVTAVVPSGEMKIWSQVLPENGATLPISSPPPISATRAF